MPDQAQQGGGQSQSGSGSSGSQSGGQSQSGGGSPGSQSSGQSDVCANCGQPRAQHGQDGACASGGTTFKAKTGQATQ